MKIRQGTTHDQNCHKIWLSSKLVSLASKSFWTELISTEYWSAWIGMSLSEFLTKIVKFTFCVLWDKNKIDNDHHIINQAIVTDVFSQKKQTCNDDEVNFSESQFQILLCLQRNFNPVSYACCWWTHVEQTRWGFASKPSERPTRS